MATKSNFTTKLVAGLAVIGVAVLASVYLLRPVAKVAEVVKGPAINAVPGNLVIQAKTPPQELKSEIGGKITIINLEPGRKVNKGDLLVQLDTSEIQLAIERQTNEREAKKKALEIGSATVIELATAERTRVVDENRFIRNEISDLEIKGKRAEMEKIKQRLELEKIENERLLKNFDIGIRQDEQRKEKMSIRAPFDGVVTAIYTSDGAVISGGERIATLITNERTVEAKISEEKFSGIAIGQDASVTFLGGVGGRNGGNVYKAKVAKILPTADPETQRYIVNLDVEGVRPEELIPGKTGEVTITVGQREANAVVPRRALSGNRLYVVKNGRIEVRSVIPGYVWLTGVEIMEGVTVGEEVLLENQDQYRDGDRVRSQVDPTTSAYEKPPAPNPVAPVKPAASK